MKTSSLYDAIRVALLVSVVGTPGSAAAWQTIEEHSTVGAAEVSPETEPSQVPEATELEQITVTGTRIRGGTSPSPVITIGAEHIREEGFTDLGEVIRSVPQNFGGGQNPGVAGGATTGAGGLANQNLTGGSSLNLRGLGPDASLTLLNGRRMSYGGFVQAVDIGAIPVEAVDRVEILPDGASALYGSDAVGGVANVLLRREYHGVGVGVRHGGATDGGLGTREYTATAGRAWASGGFILALRDASTDPLYARQRDYTRHMAHPSTWPDRFAAPAHSAPPAAPVESRGAGMRSWKRVPRSWRTPCLLGIVLGGILHAPALLATRTIGAWRGEWLQAGRHGRSGGGLSWRTRGRSSIDREKISIEFLVDLQVAVLGRVLTSESGLARSPCVRNAGGRRSISVSPRSSRATPRWRPRWIGPSPPAGHGWTPSSTNREALP